MANRMVDAARSILNSYLPDVYIYTDMVKGKEAGRWVHYNIEPYRVENNSRKIN